MSASTFADKVKSLRAFFGHADDGKPLTEAIATMNASMGLENDDGAPLPAQVNRLLEATGLTAGATIHEPVAAAAADAAGTSLGGIGTRKDPKIAKFMTRHAARNPSLDPRVYKPIEDPRQKEVDRLRTLFEGRGDGPDRYKHADFLGPNAAGALPTQIAGGISYSLSQVQDWESPCFFKEVATVQATKPAMRRDNPVSGRYPQFR